MFAKKEKFDEGQHSLTCSVIVATRNRLHDFLVFLDSLKKQAYTPTELIIVDSSDKKLQDEKLFVEKFTKKKFPKTKLIYQHTNPGLTYQRNIGVSLASEDVFYFFDDDTVLDEHYIDQMQQIFYFYPYYIGGMGAIKNVSSKKITFARLLRIFFLLQRDQASGMFTWSGMPTHTYGTEIFKDVEVLGGCCMAYRSSVFARERFDEKLSRYSYMEDCDFSCRVSRLGKLFFNPNARLDHNHSLTARDGIENNRAMYIKNYSYLFFKNIYPHNKLKVFLYFWSVVGLFTEALVYRNKSYLKGYYKGLKSFWYKL